MDRIERADRERGQLGRPPADLIAQRQQPHPVELSTCHGDVAASSPSGTHNLDLEYLRGDEPLGILERRLDSA